MKVNLALASGEGKGSDEAPGITGRFRPQLQTVRKEDGPALTSA